MKKALDALAADMNLKEIQAVIDRVARNSKEVEEIVKSIVSQYCQELDDYMAQLDHMLVDAANNGTEISDRQLEEASLNLASLLYFVWSSQEVVGIQQDVAEAIRNDVYNRVREKATGTVADKDTAAQLQSITESIVAIAYSRAYKQIRAKVEAASEMRNALKKIISLRIAGIERLGGDV